MKAFWTREKIISEASQHINAKTFRPTAAYQAAKRMNKIEPGFLTSILSQMKKAKGCTLEELILEAKKHNTITSFRNAQPSMYATYHRWKREGLDLNVFAHMTAKVPEFKTYWTEELALTEANKYSSSREFRIKDLSAFSAFYKLAKLNPELLKKTKFKKTEKKNHWDFNKCQQVAQGCKSRSEFRRKHRGAYSAAQKFNFLDEICSHMEECVVLREKYSAEAFFKSMYKNKELVIKREVKIPQRDNNPGRVDFFVNIPSFNLCLAIEFKHDESHWTKKDLKEQVSKYNRAFRERKGFCGTYLVSPSGKYGFSEKEFFYVLENLLNNEEMLLPNSLEFLRENLVA